MEPVELSGSGLLLRPWRPADAPDVLRGLRDPVTAVWNSSGVCDPDLDAARTWVARRADWSAGDHVSLAAVDPDSGVLLASVSLYKVSLDTGDASIGYWTMPAARGRGVSPRAVAVLTDWAFGELGLHRIELCHAVGNTASCRVAEKSGYLLEGTLRESYRYGDGRRHDEHIHGRLATDA